MIYENTDRIYLEIDEKTKTAAIIDKEWQGLKEIEPQRFNAFLACYNEKKMNYNTKGTKEYNLAWDSVLFSLYYSF